ncbi:MAG: VCBS repeat-containing protein [Acidobacteria bacterium]|nr:VCBS repeat-containing protein [Acidobacteriota bacterium]
MLSQGADDWAAPQTLDLGYVPFFVTTADLNNDGKPDFITCPWQRNGPTQLGVYLGNGDGTFAEAKRFYAGQNAYQVATGDFNQDGKLDLVTANNFSRGAHVLLSLGDGNFQTATNYAIGDCSAVITGDFNHDGQTDFTVANSIEAKVTIMLGKGDGTFPAKQSFAVGRGPVMLAVADFDRDGNRDLATANTTANNVTVLLGKALTFSELAGKKARYLPVP